MCGRGDQSLTWEDVHAMMNMAAPPMTDNFPPRYNIAPTTDMRIVRETDAGRVVETARWGLIPSGWKKTAKEWTYSTFNAKAETIEPARSYRGPWNNGQRCIILMNFYEWKRPSKKGDKPHYIYPTKEPAFRMAGLWSEWTDPETGEAKLTCTIITCGPNDFMKPLHDRMPVILGEDQMDAWFNAPPEETLDMLKPCPSDWMSSHRVSAKVNSTRNQGPDCIKPDDED